MHDVIYLDASCSSAVHAAKRCLCAEISYAMASLPVRCQFPILEGAVLPHPPPLHYRADRRGPSGGEIRAPPSAARACASGRCADIRGCPSPTLYSTADAKHWMDARRILRPCCAAWSCCRKGAVTSRGSCAGAVAGAWSCPRQHLRDYAGRDYSARCCALRAAPATQRSVSGGSARRRAPRQSRSGADISLSTPSCAATHLPPFTAQTRRRPLH
jgi:hypothetical protein